MKRYEYAKSKGIDGLYVTGLPDHDIRAFIKAVHGHFEIIENEMFVCAGQ